MTVHPYLEHHGPLAIAHRGGALDLPENTLEAFEAVVALGYSYIETDVHVTADGVLVMAHDETLDRTTDRTGRIRDLPWREVAAARVDGLAPIPRFDEVFEALPQVRFNIDPKHDSCVLSLADALRRHNALDRVCVGSFSDTRLARLRALFGDRLCTTMGPRAVTAFTAIARAGLPLRRPPGDCLQVPHRAGGVRLVDQRFVERAHAMGIPVIVWTIDEAEEMEELFDLGVDGIMTDRPQVLLDVIADRARRDR